MTEGANSSLRLTLSPSPMTSAHGDSLDEIQSDITNEPARKGIESVSQDAFDGDAGARSQAAGFCRKMTP